MLKKHRKQATLSSQGYKPLLVAGYDFWLVCCLFLIITIGLIMVASASISAADKYFSEPLYYFLESESVNHYGSISCVTFFKNAHFIFANFK